MTCTGHAHSITRGARMGSRYKWVLLALLLYAIEVCHSKKKQKLEIITEVRNTLSYPLFEPTTHVTQTMPDDCTQGAEIGDKLTVHYTVCM